MNTVDELPLFSEPGEWKGRVDGPGPEHARWNSVITPAADDTHDAVALLGYASDEGVLRNSGRQGAAAGPEAIRGVLGSLAIHDDHPRVDAGTVCTQGDDLEGSQEELSQRVQQLIAKNNLVVVLGGGHETSFATHRGLHRALHSKGLETGSAHDEQSSIEQSTFEQGSEPAGATDEAGSTGIVNLDAHFDLRSAEMPTSGTPFLQIAELVGDKFDYHVWGISKPNNTKVLFDTADRLGTHVVLDEELLAMTPQQVADLATATCNEHEHIHLSIDLDVLPANEAPGVSAPAGLGVPLSHIRAAAKAIAATGKVRLVDVVELNPSVDVDNRTARVAARLIDDIVAAAIAAKAN